MMVDGMTVFSPAEPYFLFAILRKKRQLKCSTTAMGGKILKKVPGLHVLFSNV